MLLCLFPVLLLARHTEHLPGKQIKKARRIFHSYFAVVASVVGSTDHFSAVAAEPSLAEFGYLAFEKS